MKSINWPALSVWVFTAQLVEHCSLNAKAMGSNPIEAPPIFFFFFWGGDYFANTQIAIRTAMAISSFHQFIASPLWRPL